MDYSKYLCCFDLTISARLIAAIGLIVSVILTVVTINDWTSMENFETTRKTAAAFGLDWQHFHSELNTTVDADPDGRTICLIMGIYATLFLVTNLLLLYATITFNKYYTIPWLICELVGCVSKTVAVVYHCVNEQKTNKLFLAGSILYIVLMVWWWLVIFAAKSSWKYQKRILVSASLLPRPSLKFCSTISTVKKYDMEMTSTISEVLNDTSIIDSSAIYCPYSTYPAI